MNVEFPKPKKDPLRAFPEKLKKRTQHFVVKKEEKIKLSVREGIDEITIDVREHATCELVVQGHGSEKIFSKILLTVSVASNGHFKVFETIHGGSRIDTQCTVSLTGNGANSEIIGRFHGIEEAHHGFFVIMQHKSQNTKGNIALRGVYENSSRAVFSGLIKVEKDAQKTNSYFRDDVLLLDQAIAESLPTLEIEANDVKASHGSTTSRINDDQLFYLESRGIPKQQARSMIIGGFLRLD